MTPASELKPFDFELKYTKRSATEIYGWYRIHIDLHTQLTAIALKRGLVELEKKLSTMSFITNPRVPLFYESVRIAPYAGLTKATSSEELIQLACDVDRYMNLKKDLTKAPKIHPTGRTLVSEALDVIDAPIVAALGAPPPAVDHEAHLLDRSLTSSRVSKPVLSTSFFKTVTHHPTIKSPPACITLGKSAVPSQTISSVQHIRYLRGPGHYTYLQEGVSACGEPLKTLSQADTLWDYAAQHDIPLLQKIDLVKRSSMMYQTLATHYSSNITLCNLFNREAKNASKEVIKLTKQLAKETPKSVSDFFKTHVPLSDEECALDFEAIRARDPLDAKQEEGKKRKPTEHTRFDEDELRDTLLDTEDPSSKDKRLKPSTL